MIDYYHILNVSPNATIDDIRKAFRSDAKKYHPDLYHGESIKEKLYRQKQFVLITQAYEVLSDKKQRKAFDLRFQKHRSKNKKPKTNTSSSYDSYTQSDGQTPPEEPWPNFADPNEETLEDLLKDVEGMLSKFGLQFRDPLEILVSWARKIFQELESIWNESESTKNKNQSFSQQEKRHSMFEDIEEELQKLKQKVENQASFKKKEKIIKNKPKKKTISPDIDQELRSLKKKYGKSL